MAKVYKDIKDNKLEISLNATETVTVFVQDDLDIHYDLKDGNYKILIFNDAGKGITLKETGSISDSEVEIDLLELERHGFRQISNIEVGKDSSLTVNTTYLGVNDKKIDYRLVNKDSGSTINISNNIVCLDGADFSLNVTGKIVKGAKRSKCFQKSRCLTFEDPKQAKVLPVLEIDENDVEASHSLSSGTIDQDVLFYMNSRGLSKRDALGLLLVSYLMPDEDFYKDFEDGLKIKEIADRKVEKICSM